MAITRVGFTTVENTGGVTNVTFAPTASVSPGDWMVAVVTVNVSQTLATPAGWTNLFGTRMTGTLGTAVFIKKRGIGETSYTVTVAATTLATVSLMWLRGVADTGWIIPTDGRTRASTGSTFNNIADPITTTSANSLVLTISTERTTATEAHFTSMTGATEWFYKAQNGSTYLETTAVGYNLQATPGATAPVTVVYPNTQASNGWAVQIGLPEYVAPPVLSSPLSLWNGTTEVPLTAKLWNGTTEVAITPDKPYNGNWHVADLLSTNPFYIAHRGGGDNWPEHTMRSYRGAANYGMKAIEVSVHFTSDNVYVCNHDVNTLRTTGVDMTINASTWAQLQTLTVTAAETVNPTQARQPIPRLSDVLAEFGNSHVLFIEPKPGGSWKTQLMAMIDSYPGTAGRIVWKNPIHQTQFAEAKTHGYTTWGYLTQGDPNQTNYAELIAKPEIDMIGVERGSPDSWVTEIVGLAKAAGKKTIMWELHSKADRDRAVALGCEGMMTANLWAVLPKFA